MKPQKNDRDFEFDSLIGESPAMKKIYAQIRQAVKTDVTMLLQGETGTGKDLVAQNIHNNSDRSQGMFVPVNLAAIPSDLIGSELFGHEKGAFTGAQKQRKGYFEIANEGTLFLDEIGVIDERLQISLLRLIENKKFTRLGGHGDILSDVRIIAATNEDLSQLVEQKKFREDLFFRLNVFSITLPPLRDRHSDIPLLIEHFLKMYNRSFNKNITGICPEILRALKTYDWPGNVRELKNVIQRAILFCEGDTLLAEHFPSRLMGNDMHKKVTFPVGTSLREIERELILQTLEMTKNNLSEASMLLEISRRTLYNKINKYNIITA